MVADTSARRNGPQHGPSAQHRHARRCMLWATVRVVRGCRVTAAHLQAGRQLCARPARPAAVWPAVAPSPAASPPGSRWGAHPPTHPEPASSPHPPTERRASQSRAGVARTVSSAAHFAFLASVVPAARYAADCAAHPRPGRRRRRRRRRHRCCCPPPRRRSSPPSSVPAAQVLHHLPAPSTGGAEWPRTRTPSHPCRRAYLPVEPAHAAVGPAESCRRHDRSRAAVAVAPTVTKRLALPGASSAPTATSHLQSAASAPPHHPPIAAAGGHCLGAMWGARPLPGRRVRPLAAAGGPGVSRPRACQRFPWAPSVARAAICGAAAVVAPTPPLAASPPSRPHTLGGRDQWRTFGLPAVPRPAAQPAEPHPRWLPRQRPPAMTAARRHGAGSMVPPPTATDQPALLQSGQAAHRGLPTSRYPGVFQIGHRVRGRSQPLPRAAAPSVAAVASGAATKAAEAAASAAAAAGAGAAG
jgi:hypothetical protein